MVTMRSYDYLIIGGGIAGVTAAETIRGEDARAAIGILSDEPHVLYSRVLLPSYLKNKIPRERLFLRTEASFVERRIDLLLQEKIAKIDTVHKEVITCAGTSFNYRKLLIASGGKVKPWGEAAHEPFTFRLQTLDDADKLRAALTRIQNPIIIGASFIALEFLEIFVQNGIQPRLIAPDRYFFERLLDPVGGELLRKNFEEHGVSALFQDLVVKVEQEAESLAVVTKSGQKITCDAIGVAIGIERSRDFLHGSPIELGERGVLTNEFLETNMDGVWAAGDIAEFNDPIAGVRHAVGNWNNAFLQGKWAGLNMLGQREAFLNVPFYSITNLGMQITALGECDGQNNDSLVRADPVQAAYERLFFRENVLAGAVLINRFQDKMHLSKLIETKTPIGEYRTRLQDPNFDVKEIPVI